jgi:hypothetical protein
MHVKSKLLSDDQLHYNATEQCTRIIRSYKLPFVHAHPLVRLSLEGQNDPKIKITYMARFALVYWKLQNY